MLKSVLYVRTLPQVLLDHFKAGTQDREHFTRTLEQVLVSVLVSADQELLYLNARSGTCVVKSGFDHPQMASKFSTVGGVQSDLVVFNS